MSMKVTPFSIYMKNLWLEISDFNKLSLVLLCSSQLLWSKNQLFPPISQDGPSGGLYKLWKEKVQP